MMECSVCDRFGCICDGAKEPMPKGNTAIRKDEADRYKTGIEQVNTIPDDQREMLDNVKPGTLPIDIDATLIALRTQYQFCADAIIPRKSADAPNCEQLGMIRDAHLNIIPILETLRDRKRESSALPFDEKTLIGKALDLYGSIDTEQMYRTVKAMRALNMSVNTIEGSAS